MIEETSSKLLWYTKSDKEVRYVHYNPSAHRNEQRLTKLLTDRTVGLFFRPPIV